ncbi:MAG: right-handed parallel beta-helix repeat-containing protein [Verrucomicrobia bacterium]|nr:right-handed parallel beta-helix repeat-containing protein [Verrucomicrobiota bacterium]MCH8525535.1 right-handed parallel beta-helix repeat-containing protein [Kiritimatiellia bacterium]
MIPLLMALLTSFGMAGTPLEADMEGPDGIRYPLFVYAGVPGGIPEIPVAVRASDFGLPGDGKSDASPAIQAALDAAAEAGGGAVLLPKGRYPIDQALHFPSDGVVLRGEDRADTVLLPRFAGSGEGTPPVLSIAREENRLRLDVALDGPVRRGQTRLSVPDPSAFEIGQRVVLTALPPASAIELLGDEGREHIAKGTYGSIYSYQHFVIREVNESELVLDRPVRLDLTREQKPVLRRVDLITGCGIENLSILQEVDRRNIHGIRLHNTADCWIRDVTMKRIGDWPVAVSRSMNFEIRDSEFDESRSMGGARAYFGLSFASDGLIDNCVIRRFRHVSIQLASNGNVFRDCVIENADINFHMHWPYENLIENCLLDATPGPDPDERSRGSYGFGIYLPDHRGGGHNPGGPRNTFFNNRVISTWDGIALGGGATFESIFAYNVFDIAHSTAAVIKPGSDRSLLFGNTFLLRDPHRRRAGGFYGTPDAGELTGAVIFPSGMPSELRVENNLFYGAPSEGLFFPEAPEFVRDNEILSHWMRPAGQPPAGAVSLAGT